MLKPFTGYYGLVTTVSLSPDLRVLVIAEDEPPLERAVNVILAGEGEFVPEKARPCVLINPEVFVP
jgi:hypothetical protein